MLFSFKRNVKGNGDAVPHGKEHDEDVPLDAVVVVVSEGPLWNYDLTFEEFLFHAGGEDVLFVVVFGFDLGDIFFHGTHDDGVYGFWLLGGGGELAFLGNHGLKTVLESIGSGGVNFLLHII